MGTPPLRAGPRRPGGPRPRPRCPPVGARPARTAVADAPAPDGARDDHPGPASSDEPAAGTRASDAEQRAGAGGRERSDEDHGPDDSDESDGPREPDNDGEDGEDDDAYREAELRAVRRARWTAAGAGSLLALAGLAACLLRLGTSAPVPVPAAYGLGGAMSALAAFLGARGRTRRALWLMVGGAMVMAFGDQHPR